ncbi:MULTISPECIES: hypothetical protein [unclassified Thiocapsa]
MSEDLHVERRFRDQLDPPGSKVLEQGPSIIPSELSARAALATAEGGQP